MATFGYFVTPIVLFALSTVSTDDAYVNSHVTFVAPRVSGQVSKVLVDDNNRVRKGDLIVQLDREPYEVQLKIKQAAVDLAMAQLLVARNQVNGIVAQARSNRFKLDHAIEDVHNQIALLSANVATWESKKATLVRAQADLERNKPLVEKGVLTRQELDKYEEAFRVGEAAVKQALEQVYQVRVALGLPAQPADGSDLTIVPPDLDQTFSSVRQAVGDLLQSFAPLGVLPPSYSSTPKEIVAAFKTRDSEGNVDRIYSELVKTAPIIKQAEATLAQAERDLDQVKLNLRYCNVYAEIDGVVTRRNVNPGNNVQSGQALMAIRSLTEVWIDANFKETQLARLRIGQRVDLEVDMYGHRRKFNGRISGFTMGTGSTLSLLPAQNATGNFIKVVQRLPVRIEPVNYEPDQDPLFVGLSVTPMVYIHEPPTGPDAGKVLQPNFFSTNPTASSDTLFGDREPNDRSKSDPQPRETQP
ncbi:HlyD family secretion protein [Schlesneria paludicola]|uniref:HlyD family secretion protein n=1 Tax=Schlesneria paludicola TaxID=360056 RepID=UPI00192C17E9|nr:HlyD family secretion protein [Schlesneria paludicola]